jgi:hypothetical protein
MSKSATRKETPMSLDHCKSCGRRVDTDYDCDAYDNPEKACLCSKCREEQPELKEVKAMTRDQIIHTALTEEYRSSKANPAVMAIAVMEATDTVGKGPGLFSKISRTINSVIMATEPVNFSVMVRKVTALLPAEETVQPKVYPTEQPVELSQIEQLLCVADDCRSLIECGLERDALFSISAIKQLLIALSKATEREIVVGDLLDHLTHQATNGQIKFNTDFIPQVIAEYEMGLRRNLDGNVPGAVYNAMEFALDKFILQPILKRFEQWRRGRVINDEPFETSSYDIQQHERRVRQIIKEARKGDEIEGEKS